MKKAINYIKTIYEKLTQWESVALLLARLCIGTVFIQTGFGKLMHFGQTVSFFETLGIPYPMMNAAAAASIECFGGILLVLGLLTRVVSVKLAVVMIVAIITAQLSEIANLSDFIRLQEVDYLLFFIVFIFAGAGKFSVDYWIKKQLN